MKFLKAAIVSIALLGMAAPAQAWTWYSFVYDTPKPKVKSYTYIGTNEWEDIVTRIRCVAQIYHGTQLKDTGAKMVDRNGNNWARCITYAKVAFPQDDCLYCDGDTYQNNRSNGSIWDNSGIVLSQIQGTLTRGHLFCEVYEENPE